MKIPCSVLSRVVDHFAGSKSEGQVYEDLSRIVNTITGQKLIRNVQFDPAKKPAETCLTRFYLRGSEQAERIRPFLNPRYDVVEYGGGIGRLAQALVGDCRSLTVAEVNPLMIEYGPVICPEIDFQLLDRVSRTYDFIYSIAVFFHLNRDVQDRAVKWVHDHLKPGGKFLLDLILVRGKTNEPRYVDGKIMGSVNRRDFFRSLSPYFEIKRVRLFNSGLLLTKKAK